MGEGDSNVVVVLEEGLEEGDIEGDPEGDIERDTEGRGGAFSSVGDEEGERVDEVVGLPVLDR